MGKDNITFHSQIWPAELLAYDGRGDRGGEPGEYGDLNLPTEVVSSEFLTMEGKQFSSSRGVVIYVRDVLSRYQPDALRYFISAAGPENQDSNFTWAEFVRRTNDELVAGWGNLVNRTANMIAKSFGEIPAAGELTAEDQALLDAVEAAFEAVGELIGRHRQKAALAEAMRTVAEVNKYVSDSAPWQLKGDDERDRLGDHPARHRAGGRRLQPAARAVPAAQRQRGRPGARRRRGRRADARDPGGRGPRRRARLPDPDRRVLRHPRVAAAPGRGRHAGGQAGPGVHQARPVGGRRRARPAAEVSLHPQAVHALELWSAGPASRTRASAPTTMATMRRAQRVAAAAEEHEPVDRVEDVDADGVPCRLFVPAGATAALVFLHGGGFAFGDLDTHDAQSRRLANRTGRAVLAVDYRRPPEHPFPAAPDDVDTALRWLERHAAGLSLDPARTATVGDSAGGNLALVAALRNPDLVAACALVYPFVDATTSGASYAATDGGLTLGEAQWYWRQYAATPADLLHADLSPLGSERARVRPADVRPRRGARRAGRRGPRAGPAHRGRRRHRRGGDVRRHDPRLLAAPGAVRRRRGVAGRSRRVADRTV